MIDPSGMYSFPVYINGKYSHTMSGENTAEKRSSSNSNDNEPGDDEDPPKQSIFYNKYLNKLAPRNIDNPGKGWEEKNWKECKELVNKYGTEIIDLTGKIPKTRVFQNKQLANYLYSRMFIPSLNVAIPISPNPFKGAVAIAGDVGFLMSGTVGNIGGYFILVGDHAGRFFPFTEGAAGIGPDGGLSGEIARVDFSGNPKDFKVEYLYGERQKGYGGIGSGWWSVGGGYAYGDAGKGSKYTISATSASISFGGSLFGLFSLGYNIGNIKPIK
jgi:hypothetical protein